MTLSNLAPVTLPYDTHCPSVRKDILQRTCPLCKRYFTSIAAVLRHKRGNGCPSSLTSIRIPRSVLDVDEILDEVVTDREVTDVDLQTAPVIDILQMIRSNPFMEIDVINEGEESDLD